MIITDTTNKVKMISHFIRHIVIETKYYTMMFLYAIEFIIQPTINNYYTFLRKDVDSQQRTNKERIAYGIMVYGC